jgi:hypothetical protein
MIWLIIGLTVWLVCGALGSYLGHTALQRIYPCPTSLMEYCTYGLTALAGPFNTVVVLIMFRKQLF